MWRVGDTFVVNRDGLSRVPFGTRGRLIRIDDDQTNPYSLKFDSIEAESFNIYNLENMKWLTKTTKKITVIIEV